MGTTYCPACHNTGEVDCYCGGDLCVCGREVEECPECDGAPTDGEWGYCPTCQGSGRVNPLTAPKGTLCLAAMDCPHCDGKGY